MKIAAQHRQLQLALWVASADFKAVRGAPEQFEALCKVTAAERDLEAFETKLRLLREHPEPDPRRLDLPDLWPRLGRPGAIASLRLAAAGLQHTAAMMIPPEYREDVASIILAIDDLTARIEADHQQGGSPPS